MDKIEFRFLYLLQELHTPLVDGLMTFITTLGDHGIFWLLLAAVLFAVPRTRMMGGCMLISIGIGFLLLGVYGLIYAMTGGGPGNKTMTLPIYMYNQGLKGMQLGFGTAIGMLILAVGALCSVFYTILLKKSSKDD